LEILTEEEARAKPAGRAREEPNENPKLEAPQYDLCKSISILKKISFRSFQTTRNIISLVFIPISYI
jgi:hypothetical protein